MEKDFLNKLKENIDLDERREFEDKNSLWKEYHKIVDKILDQEIELDALLNNSLELALRFLNSTEDKESLLDIVVGFENLNDLILAAFLSYNKDYSETNQYNLMREFNSLLFESEDYMKEIKKIIQKLKVYLLVDNDSV